MADKNGRQYKLGFSTGWWTASGRSPELVGLGAKMGYGVFFGVDVLQIDLETIQEFNEPNVDYQIKKVKQDLGLDVGIHALINEQDALETADRKFWEISHRNAVVTIRKAVDHGLSFVNFHLSLNPQLIMRESQLRPFGHTYQVVGPDGYPLYKLGDRYSQTKEEIKQWLPRQTFADADVLDKAEKRETEDAKKKAEKDLQNWLKGDEFSKRKKEISDYVKSIGAGKKEADQAINNEIERARQQFIQARLREASERFREDKNFQYELWKESQLARYFIEAGEIGAYLIVAHHMWTQREPLWMNIVGDKSPRYAYENLHQKFNAAVAAFYLKGHLTIKNDPFDFNKKHLGGMSIVEFANKNKIRLTFEVPHVGNPGAAEEGKYRLFDPRDSQYFIRDIGSPYIGLCIDIEHMLSQGLNPGEVFTDSKLFGDFGSMVHVIHVGKPIGYGGTAHIPIPMGSLAQEALYEWLYLLRKRGFKSGYIIYERGGGDTPLKVVEQSIHAIRLIGEYLEQGIDPKELPEKFYGMSEMNDDRYKQQLVAVRDHAWDPLKGLVIIPEEEHTFLSRAAVEKGKAEEWKRAKFR